MSNFKYKVEYKNKKSAVFTVLNIETGQIYYMVVSSYNCHFGKNGYLDQASPKRYAKPGCVFVAFKDSDKIRYMSAQELIKKIAGTTCTKDIKRVVYAITQLACMQTYELNV